MKNTLVIFQCCKTKNGYEKFPEKDSTLYDRLPTTKRILQAGFQNFLKMGVIDAKSNLITALSRYNGHFYKTPSLRSALASEIKNGPSDFLIMSAGYGFVHPFQKIYNYDQQMKGKTTKYWLAVGLPKVLEEFIETGNYTSIWILFQNG